MNIISNNCIGGFLYKLNHLEYKNPFIWHQISSSDFAKLMNTYDSIYFEDFELEVNRRRLNKEYIISDTDVNCCHIRLSCGITIYYNHYKCDNNAHKPTKIGFDIFYDRNFELTYTKYVSRLERMTEKPVFVYFYKEPRNDKDPKTDVLKMIGSSERNNQKLVLIVDFDIDVKSKNVFLIKESHLTPPHIVAEKYNQSIMQFLAN